MKKQKKDLVVITNDVSESDARDAYRMFVRNGNRIIKQHVKMTPEIEDSTPAEVEISIITTLMASLSMYAVENNYSMPDIMEHFYAINSMILTKLPEVTGEGVGFNFTSEEN